jgi:hypothetical protein
MITGKERLRTLPHWSRRLDCPSGDEEDSGKDHNADDRPPDSGL